MDGKSPALCGVFCFFPSPKILTRYFGIPKNSPNFRAAMQDLLHIYKRRLTNLGQNNRSLRLSRLSARKDIDWKDFGFLDEAPAEELLQRLISGKDVKLLSKLDARFEPANVMDQRLNQLFRTVASLEEETGAYDLFVGYPFAEGKFAGGEAVRCPVALLPVKLIRQLNARPRWKLEPAEDQPVMLNPTFFLAYEQFQKSRLKPEFWETELPPNDDWGLWLTHLHQLLNSFDVEVNFNSSLFGLKLEAFRDYQKSVFEEMKTGVIRFRSQAVLGIFPQSDSALLQDYESLLEDPDQFTPDAWFRTAAPVPEKYIREEDRFFVTPLDQSQENALLRIKAGESLVVFGPPGTGKSQVIVNMMADAMAHGKRVLLVSQKRAALDVVYKRLSALDLGRFAMLVHDHRADRGKIYHKISRLIEDMPELKRSLSDLNYAKWDHEYKLLSRQADQFHREFEALHEALNDRSVCGLSVHELYLIQDVGGPLLPVKEAAQTMDAARLEQFASLLKQAGAYAEFFLPGYPWRQRLSFHHFGTEDRSQLLTKVKPLAQEVTALHAELRQLAPPWQALGADPDAAGKWLEQFGQIKSFVESSPVRYDLDALAQGGQSAKSIRKTLDTLSELVRKMASRRLLADFPWTLFETAAEHLVTLTAAKRPEWWRIKWLRARWFWNRWLSAKNKELTEETLRQLVEEFKPMQAWRDHYLRLFEAAFFENFPVYDPDKVQAEWVMEKRKHLEAFEQVMAFSKAGPVDFFPKNGLQQDKWEDAAQGAIALAAFRSRWTTARANWHLFLHPGQIARLDAAVIGDPEAADYATRLSTCLESDFFDLQALDTLLSQVPSTELAALEALAPHFPEYPNIPELVAAVRNSFWLHWIERIETRFPVLKQVGARGWSQKQEEYSEKLEKRLDLSANLVRHRVRERIVGLLQYNRLGNAVTYRELLHQVTKKRLIWPVRKLVQQFWDQGLATLAPCWLASPESVAAIFPMESGFFDLVIFDEASQCFVERALPVMLRGKQTVIAGDNQQLQPLDLYRMKVDDSDEIAEADAPEALETESILDLARIRLPEVRLEWHYRSVSEALIAFSNRHFYDGRLAMTPPAYVAAQDLPPITWVDAGGIWEKQRNLIEAERVVDLVMELVRRPDQPSIGIVTFNFFQQELIRDLLDRQLESMQESNPAGRQLLYDALHKVEGEEYVGLFVKNIENVQGDERDIIIFSVGYGPDTQGKVHARFGLLNQHGGAHRLNVAVTRARRKVYVVSSVLPEQLAVDESAHDGPRLFREYLRYARAVSRGEGQVVAASGKARSQVSQWLQARLEAEGHQVSAGLGLDAYRLDLAVADPASPGRWALGIECEGPNYFSGQTPKEREVYRPAMLRARNWKVVRVWARNFWLDKEEVWKAVRGEIMKP